MPVLKENMYFDLLSLSHAVKSNDYSKAYKKIYALLILLFPEFEERLR